MTVLPQNHPLRETRVMDDQQVLRCSKCRNWKPLDQFHTNRRTRSGYQSFCKPCQKEAKAKSLEKHRDKLEALRATNRVRKAVQRSFSQKTPMSRKPKKTQPRPSTARKKRLPAMSEDKKAWNQLYKARHGSDPEMVHGFELVMLNGTTPSVMKILERKDRLERHHVGRRWRWLILWYRYVTPVLHEWIEANSKKARELGLLFNVVRGELVNPSKHDPFGCMDEFHNIKKTYGLVTFK